MPPSRAELLRWQFDLTWSLFEYHLERLQPDDFLAEPAPACWTLRPSDDGGWAPDWADVEPDPVPVPTIAWLRALRTTWTTVLDRLADADLDRPTAYPWPAEAGLSLAHLASWVNAELMKNAAEIGQLRMLRAAHGDLDQTTF